MSEIAVKIMRNVAVSPPPYTWVTELFYEHEVSKTPIWGGVESIIKILGTGKPKIINRSTFNRIAINFNLFSTNLTTSSTLTKLKKINEYSLDGGKLIIYPIYKKDPDFFKICIMPAGQIPNILGVAGQYSGRESIPVNFLEIEKNIGVVGEDEV